jgi:hypothetical protein
MSRWIPFLIALFTVTLTSCQRNTLPSINEPAQLRNDCAVLYERYPIPTNLAIYDDTHWRMWIIEKIPQEAWPRSVKSLNPRLVCTDYFGVRVTIHINKESHKENWSQKGYYLQFNTNVAAPRSADHGQGPFYLKSTIHDGIDEFLMPISVL